MSRPLLAEGKRGSQGWGGCATHIQPLSQHETGPKAARSTLFQLVIIYNSCVFHLRMNPFCHFKSFPFFFFARNKPKKQKPQGRSRTFWTLVPGGPPRASVYRPGKWRGSLAPFPDGCGSRVQSARRRRPWWAGWGVSVWWGGDCVGAPRQHSLVCLPTGQLPGWPCSTPCPPSALDFRCRLPGPCGPLSPLPTLGWSPHYRQDGGPGRKDGMETPGLAFCPYGPCPQDPSLWKRGMRPPHHRNCGLHPDSAT